MPTVQLKTILESPELDSKKYRRRLQDYMDEQHKIAVKRWLINVLKHTPTYTGTARGTYAPVGRAIGRAVRKGVARGNLAGAAKKKHFKYQGRSWLLGFAAGANYSEHEIKSRKYRDKLHYRFRFDQRLPYVLWNEVLPAPAWMKLPSNPPWHALEHAANAYVRYSQRIARGFPFPEVKITRVRKGF